MKYPYYPVLCACVALAGVCMPAVSHAAVVRIGEEYARDASSVIEGDQYLVGKTVTVLGTTTGDVFVGASEATLAGITLGDALLVGGEVDVHSTKVTGDTRLMGGKVYVRDSVVGEDLVVAAGEVVIAPSTRVAGDLIVFADRLVLDGTVAGSLEAHVRTAELRGEVQGGASVAASEALTVAGTARMGGELAYSSPRPATIDPAASTTAGVRQEQSDAAAPATEGTGAALFIMYVLVTAGAAVTLTLLFPTYVRRTTDEILADLYMFTALKGLLALVTIPLVIVGLFLTVAGIMPGILLIVVYGGMFCVGLSLMPILAGALLVRVLRQNARPAWAWAVLGALMLALVRYVPYVGPLVHMLLFLLTFGAVAVGGYRLLVADRRAAAVPEPEPHEPEATPSSGSGTEETPGTGTAPGHHENAPDPTSSPR